MPPIEAIADIRTLGLSINSANEFSSSSYNQKDSIDFDYSDEIDLGEINKRQNLKISIVIIEDDNNLISSYQGAIQRGLLKYNPISLPLLQYDSVSMGKEKLQLVNENKGLLLKKAIFLIDINLGEGKEQEGLVIIKELRKNFPRAIILVLTAYHEYREKAINLGADEYFLKSFDLKNNFRQILNIIDRYIESIVIKENLDKNEFLNEPKPSFDALKENTNFKTLKETPNSSVADKELKDKGLQKVHSQEGDNKYNDAYLAFIRGAGHNIRDSLYKLAILKKEIKDLVYHLLPQLHKDSLDKLFNEIFLHANRVEELLMIFSSDKKDELINVEDIIKQNIEWFKNQSLKNELLSDQSIVFLQTHGDGIPDIKGDPRHFSMIVNNILSNSIKAIIEKKRTSIGKVKVVSSIYKSIFLLVIEDNGIGMDDKIIKKVFQPYFYGRKNGTGLGLFITKEILEKQFNGKIYCKSKLGHWTKFFIEIPV